MTGAETVPADPTDALLAYVGRQRWFSGSADATRVQQITALAWIGGDDPAREPQVRVELVDVVTDGRAVRYQLPVSVYATEQPRLAHALVCVREDTHGTRHVYDALHDRAGIARLLTGFIEPPPPGVAGAAPDGDTLTYETLGEVALDPDGPALLITGEQSNSSLVVGDDLICKFFRKLTDGRNPDIELHAALTEAGSTAVAPLRGWLSAFTSSGDHDLAMLQDFMRSASDGWEVARASVRSLLMDPDLDEERAVAGGLDFAGESEALGAVVAEVHAALRSRLDAATWHRPEVERLQARLHGRLDAAVAQAPALAEFVDGVREVYDALDSVEQVAVQRVHGDLHLGQTLRTVTGWIVLDFEGEPAAPLPERVALDSPLRDVAGMLRSYGYAASSVVVPQYSAEAQATGMRAWAEASRAAFLRGYGLVTGDDHDPDVLLLRAYELDKAVYEVVYEVGHRPDWVGIPLGAVRRLTHH